jgi:hypothetical protein
MRARVSIAFLMLYLVAYTEMHEVLLVPVLFEHYSEHKTLNSELTFSDFLSWHYFSSHGSEDTATHESLPFGHNHEKIDNVNFAFPVPPEISLKDPFVIHFNTGYNNPFSYNRSQSPVWQPPKIS